MIILSLCDQTHIWGGVYEDDYEVVYCDLADGNDVRLKLWDMVDNDVQGIICQPPCTSFAVSGARWWSGKGVTPLLEGLSIVDARLRAVAIYRPAWCILENPRGRLSSYLGPPQHTFDPTEYGEPWTKFTCLWGSFTMPQRYVNQVEGDDRIHKMPPSPDRGMKRSIPPANFCQAFREYNL